MSYEYLEDLKGITDLRDLGGTASLALSAFHGIRIRPTDSGEKIFYQFVGEKPEEIQEVEIEYFGPIEEVLDTLNVDEDEFEEEYGGTIPGFYIEDTIYLIAEFMRDDYGK